MLLFFRKFDAKQITLRDLSSQVFEWVYDDRVYFNETAYVLDHLEEISDDRGARWFVAELLPGLESMDADMSARIAAHLSQLSAS